MILVARHGETEWNRTGRYQGHADPPLNDTGRKQGKELARTLAAKPPESIYASDLRRAFETAEIVGAHLGISVERDRGLREIDVGSWQGLTNAEIDGRPWDGETYEAHRERVVAAIRRIAAQHPAARVLVVAHGGSLRRIQEAVLGEAQPVIEHCGLWGLVVDGDDLRRLD